MKEINVNSWTKIPAFFTGKAIIIYDGANLSLTEIEYRLDGQRHRIDGPSLICF